MYYTENSVVYLNDQFVNANQSAANFYSQTLHYGYGAFEGIRSYATSTGTQVFKEREHYQRLLDSCKALNMKASYSVDELVDLTYELLKKNNLQDAYVRPLVYCGPNMSLTKPEEVSLFMAAWEWGAYLGERMLKVAVSSYCRPHPKSTPIEAKVCGHYVNSTLATTEAKDKGFDEALLLDVNGFLAEGPGANLFFEKDGLLYTPELGNILPGITRATVLELAHQLGFEVQEGQFSLADLYQADAAFYCGTAAEVVGIELVDDYKIPLNWKDSLGFQLQTAYTKLVRTPQHTLQTAL